MKENKTTRLLTIALIIALIALILVASSYAKYLSSGTGSDSARVAKWSFKVGENDIVATDTFKFDLFKTITETDGRTEEADVVSANSDRVIAPGTSGSFELVLENKSEVSAKYGIEYTVANTASIPVQFSVDGGKTWTESLTDVVADDTNTKLAANSGSKTITVQWKWAYDGTDTKDVELGKYGTAKLEVSAKVTATQID